MCAVPQNPLLLLLLQGQTCGCTQTPPDRGHQPHISHWETGLEVCPCREDTDSLTVLVQAGMCLLHSFHGISY